MKKRTVVWFLTALLAVVAAGAIVWGATGTFDKIFTQAELQKKIDEKMPLVEKTVTVQNVQLSLADNKINLTFDASTVKFRKQYAISANATGQMRFDSERGAFFFKPENVAVSNFTVNDRVVGSKVNALVDRLLGDSKLADRKDDLQDAINDKLQSVVQNGTQIILERIPVYKLKDDIKGTVIKMSLNGVEVRDNTVIAHISFWRLTLSVFLGCIAILFAIVITVCLAMSPGWGMLPLLL